jgi:hypothetical protein
VSRIVIALLLWSVAMATAHAQWRQMPGQPDSDLLADCASIVDVHRLPMLAVLARPHRL